MLSGRIDVVRIREGGRTSALLAPAQCRTPLSLREKPSRGDEDALAALADGNEWRSPGRLHSFAFLVTRETSEGADPFVFVRENTMTPFPLLLGAKEKG